MPSLVVIDPGIETGIQHLVVTDDRQSVPVAMEEMTPWNREDNGKSYRVARIHDLVCDHSSGSLSPCPVRRRLNIIKQETHPRHQLFQKTEKRITYDLSNAIISTVLGAISDGGANFSFP